MEMIRANGPLSEADRKEIVEKFKDLYYGPDQTVRADDIYNKIDKEYERNMKGLQYVGPSTLAAKVNYYAQDNKDVRILDVGCGTGLVAMELKKFGFTNIDGVDASKSLLEQAKPKKLYKHTLRAFVGEDPLSLDSGGLFMLMCNYEAWKLEEHLHVEMQLELDALEKSKQWRRLEWAIMDEYAVYDDIQKGLFFVYKKTTA